MTNAASAKRTAKHATVLIANDHVLARDGIKMLVVGMLGRVRFFEVGYGVITPVGKSASLKIPRAPAASASVMEQIAHRLKTQQGKKLYALRKPTLEPVFGIIKSVMGFRQFLLRGFESAKAEWNLVTMSWNIRRMFALRVA